MLCVHVSSPVAAHENEQIAKCTRALWCGARNTAAESERMVKAAPPATHSTVAQLSSRTVIYQGSQAVISACVRLPPESCSSNADGHAMVQTALAPAFKLRPCARRAQSSSSVLCVRERSTPQRRPWSRAMPANVFVNSPLAPLQVMGMSAFSGLRMPYALLEVV